MVSEKHLFLMTTISSCQNNASAALQSDNNAESGNFFFLHKSQFIKTFIQPENVLLQQHALSE